MAYEERFKEACSDVDAIISEIGQMKGQLSLIHSNIKAIRKRLGEMVPRVIAIELVDGMMKPGEKLMYHQLQSRVKDVMKCGDTLSKHHITNLVASGKIIKHGVDRSHRTYYSINEDDC